MGELERRRARGGAVALISQAKWAYWERAGVLICEYVGQLGLDRTVSGLG